MDRDHDHQGATGEGAGAAMGIAMNEATRDPSLAEDARTLLLEQARLARLQADDLTEDGALMRRSLHIRHASEMMKFAFELLVALVLLAIVAALGTAMWNAAHSDGLVIEAFSVPPDFAQRGLSGQVVASQLLDKLARMQQQTNSIRPADTYRNNWGDDIKVEIPDTGISIGELNRYLRRWLGRETHITGEIYHTPAGIAVTARAQDAGSTFTGRESDFDGLLQKAAEAIYAETQPYRYAAFLNEKNRNAEAMHVIKTLAAESSPAERAWALSLLGNMYMFYGRPGQALATLREGVAADPTNAHAWDNLSSAEQELGHLEGAYRHTQQALLLYDKGVIALDPDRLAIIKLQDKVDIAEIQGSYRDGAAMDLDLERLPDRNGSRERAALDRAAALAFDHELTNARRLLTGNRAADTNARLNLWFQTAAIAYLAHDWNTLGHVMDRTTVLGMAPPDFHPVLGVLLSRLDWLPADAKAQQGDIAGARAVITTTPLDCYDCVRTRGKIEAAARNWAGAAYWFGKAVQQAPSIPDAFSDWGAMLVAKGDYDGAIAKFETAHAKGPRFADPLEMWGEALMAKNRSDRALAKFEEANRYAPNWGRLHLKWGEALDYAGQKKDAEAQFATAARLDLFPTEKRELQKRVMHHG